MYCTYLCHDVSLGAAGGAEQLDEVLIVIRCVEGTGAEVAREGVEVKREGAYRKERNGMACMMLEVHLYIRGRVDRRNHSGRFTGRTRHTDH